MAEQTRFEYGKFKGELSPDYSSLKLLYDKNTIATFNITQASYLELNVVKETDNTYTLKYYEVDTPAEDKKFILLGANKNFTLAMIQASNLDHYIIGEDDYRWGALAKSYLNLEYHNLKLTISLTKIGGRKFVVFWFSDNFLCNVDIASATQCDNGPENHICFCYKK
jgi:hypothetical protein